MPSTGTLLAFSLAAFVLIVVPGPNVIFIVARGVEQGRPAAVVSALGVETGSLFHIAAAAVGLSALLASSDLAFDVVRYLGAAYLLYLGLRTLLRRDGSTAGADANATSAPRLWHAYRQAILVNVFNPKVALFFLAFLPQFVDPARGAAWVQVLMLGVVFMLLGLCVGIVYASAAGTIGHWVRRRPHALRWQRFTSGGVYVTLGVAAALTGSR
jgi:threonine/homoserine/homoserine lactone efflux protein